MTREIIAFVAGALLLSPVAARATLVEGSFTGTIIAGGGTDTSGVFGTPGADLSNDPVTGTFEYNTALFAQSVSGGTNTATGTGLGALTVTITIGGSSYTFTDPTSSSVFLDDGSVSANNEITLSNTNNQSLGGGKTIGESFTLDAQDPINSFITGTSLVQTFNETPLISSGSFNIQDTGPAAQAQGDFTVDTITEGPLISSPEPASLALLTVGLGGVTWIRRRRAGAR